MKILLRVQGCAAGWLGPPGCGLHTGAGAVLKILGAYDLIGGMAPGTKVRVEANHLLPGRVAESAG